MKSRYISLPAERWDEVCDLLEEYRDVIEGINSLLKGFRSTADHPEWFKDLGPNEGVNTVAWKKYLLIREPK